MTLPFWFQNYAKLRQGLVINSLPSMDGWSITCSLSHQGRQIECILFGTKSKLRINSEVNVTCFETHVAAKQSVRYLGVDLDQSLDVELIAEANLKK